MVWGDSIKKRTNSLGRRKGKDKCNSRLLIYVTAEEKRMLIKRAKEKSQSISFYMRFNLKPMFKYLKELYARKEEEKSN